MKCGLTEQAARTGQPAKTNGDDVAEMTLTDFMEMQQQLQIGMKEANPTQGGDPLLMDSETRAYFITWNAYALCDEVHESTAECGWKPWASSRHVNHPAAMQELVDAWHFFLNLLLAYAGAADLNIDEMATQFENYYLEKNKKNLQRQVDGYDGVSTKCPSCKRELSEVGTIRRADSFFCSGCGARL